MLSVQLGPGASIGAYVLEELLGSGAFGVVWLGRHSESGERVAIKILHPEAAVNRENVERFKREAWALSQLQSAHIARMFEMLTGPPYEMALVMEYIEGELLSDVLKRARFSVEDALGLGVGILSGVAEMQSMGIIHRDIKPENIILRPNPDGWHAVIFDFNLSRVKGKGKTSSLTSMHAAIGTVPYMSPEQLLDARRVTEASDVYSVGAILYRAVQGELPFDLKRSMKEKLQQEAAPLETGRDDRLAKGFERIVMKSLRRRPAERYAKAQNMLDELARLASEGM
ncbi:MAG: serine/threonine protein kinase [Labilithrix sp.]|nr:serine/threonine protein kinase [Labilithrix sp.]